MENLPSETVSDILSRLPTDSLSESRRVCQSWNNTIYDPYFVTNHQLQLQLQLHNQNTALILLIRKHNKTDCQLYYAEYDPDKSDFYKLTAINHPAFTNWHNDHTIVGSSNGLVCISKHFVKDPLYVFNPMTQECVYLPRFTHKVYVSGVMVSGFGFCPSTNDYKVVRMLYRCRAGDSVDQSFLGRVQVYTLGKDTKWRRKGKSPYLLDSRKPGVLVNGALHWLTEKDACVDYVAETCYKIVAFDLAEEEFRVVPSPPCFCLGDNNAYDVMELGGCLCIKKFFRDGRNEIWKMKDYVTKEWTMEFAIEGKGDRLVNYTPVSVTRDGEVLLWEEDPLNGYSKKLVSYDPKIGDFWEIDDYGIVDRLDAVTYSKSWVSLKAVGERPVMIREDMESGKIVRERKRKRTETE